eukprot:20503-Eustigmatos_ZCMA.PRE.1
MDVLSAPHHGRNTDASRTLLSALQAGCCRPEMAAKGKDAVLDLNKYLDKAVRVRFQGGREGGPCTFLAVKHPNEAGTPPNVHCSSPNSTVEGILKGFDQLVNIVLDESKEFLR